MASTETWLNELTWDGLKGFLEADRVVWREAGGVTKGYIQQYEPLTFVTVVQAGHMVPMECV